MCLIFENVLLLDNKREREREGERERERERDREREMSLNVQPVSHGWFCVIHRWNTYLQQSDCYFCEGDGEAAISVPVCLSVLYKFL